MAEDYLKIKRALITVNDKTGLIEFATKLSEHGVEIISTGGTHKALVAAGIASVPLESLTAFPEMLDGRVKTLQPEVFAPILARKNNDADLRQISERGLSPIDMVVCNFYDFKWIGLRTGSEDEELIEKIDIGGPSVIRAAAKNYGSVCAVPSVEHYKKVAEELDKYDGKISAETRKNLALDAFRIVADYDTAITRTLDYRTRRTNLSKIKMV